jgi:hypothetical protein
LSLQDRPSCGHVPHVADQRCHSTAQGPSRGGQPKQQQQQQRKKQKKMTPEVEVRVQMHAAAKANDPRVALEIYDRGIQEGDALSLETAISCAA